MSNISVHSKILKYLTWASLPKLSVLENSHPEYSTVLQWKEALLIDFRKQWRLKFESKGLHSQCSIIKSVIHTEDELLLTVVLILVATHYLTTVGEIKLYYMKRTFCIMGRIQSASLSEPKLYLYSQNLLLQ